MTDGLPPPTTEPIVPFAKDEYANLNARAASSEAQALVSGLYDAISRWELQSGGRTYERAAATAPRFRDALERFVGDLLLARADEVGTGRLYLLMNKNGFKGDRMPVSYTWIGK